MEKLSSLSKTHKKRGVERRTWLAKLFYCKDGKIYQYQGKTNYWMGRNSRRWLAPNATVMSWRGTRGAIQAAKEGHDVILTPGSHCYFDHYQSENENEPLAIGGFLPDRKSVV